MKTKKCNARKGLSLVEMMIAVTVAGIFAAVIIAAFDTSRRNAQNEQFIKDLRTLAQSLEVCVMDTGEVNQGAPAGQLSADFAKYANKEIWMKGPNIGGQWKVDYNTAVGLGIGVAGCTIPLDQLLEIDRKNDDGNLFTGTLQKLSGDRYYWVIQQELFTEKVAAPVEK